MNAFQGFLRMGSVLAVLVLSASLTYAWPGLVHILITEEAGYPELKFYANGPDTYKSTQPLGEGLMPSNYFAWTHILLTVDDWGTPIEGVEDPAYDMWILATKKLEGLSGQELDVARKTALGWRAHMAADRIVHFDYFPGGTILNWIQHGEMEGYAAIMAYVDIVCSGVLTDAFNVEFDAEGNWVGDDHGSVKEGYEVQWPGHWGLVSLAQRVYLKNQRKTDNPEPETIWPETAQTIGGQAAARESELQGAINGWEFGGQLLDFWPWNEYYYAIAEYGQLLTQDAPAGSTVLHVKHMYSWAPGGYVVITSADGSVSETRTIVARNRANRTVTVYPALTHNYSGNGAVGSDYVRYIGNPETGMYSGWEPWEVYYEESVTQVVQGVESLEAE